MHWLFLLIALGAFALAVTTPNTWLLVLALLMALLFVMLWVKGLYVAKFGDGAASVPRPLHPSELQAMREQLKSKATQAAPASASPVNPPSPPAGPDPQHPQ